MNDLPSGVEGLAFIDGNGKTSMLLMNMLSTAQSVDLTSAGSFDSAFQTTADADWTSVTLGSSVDLPAYSITSFL